MIDRSTKLRWRRRFRRGQKQVEDLGYQAEDNLEKHLFNRLSRLALVRRFIAGWTVLFLLLIGLVFYQTKALGRYYLALKPADGGIFTEGIIGSFTNANPLYAASSVDNSVSRLVFSGLFKFDSNNQLVGDLASGWTIDDRGTTYTVRIKDNMVWQDGHPLTSADVVYTYNMIQNPDAKSPLASSWQGIKVTAVDDLTVSFTLPSILSAFPYSMTNGLVPKHLLDGVPPAQLRSVSFNSNKPIGAGPFRWEAVEVIGVNPEEREQRIALTPNPTYAGGAPKLDKFIIRSFQSQEKLLDALKNREVSAAAGLTTVPDTIKSDQSIRDYNIPLTSQVLLFMKTTSDTFRDIKVRQAVALALDTRAVRQSVGRPVLPSDSPLLTGQLGYDKNIVQRTNNREQAKNLLTEAGWVPGGKGLRMKDGRPLIITITTQNNSIYNNVARDLKRQLALVGVHVEVLSQSDQELQSSLAVHNYDALLYGVALSPDPDVFAYWHSSQADLRSPSHLNFSEYTSEVANKSLEAGRTRSEQDVRALKYRPFLESWVKDVPAVALYQPRYLYAARDPLFGFNSTSMNNGTDRYNNVENWQIRESDQPL